MSYSRHIRIYGFLCVSLSVFILIPGSGVFNSALAGWVPEGVEVAQFGTTDARYTASMPDGDGGTIIAWLDDETPPNIYLQRLDPDGSIMWYPGGVQITGASFYEGTAEYPTRLEMATDCLKGVIITWPDSRNADIDIYAQRVDSLGYIQWDEGGEVVCDESGDQLWPDVVSNDDQGAFIAWLDRRNSNGDIYCQLLDDQGDKSWVAAWEVRTVAGSDAGKPVMTNEGDGEALIVWHDGRGSDHDIYASRFIFDPPGGMPTDGTVICDSPGYQVDPKIIADGAGGSIIAWIYSNVIYAQRYAAFRQWGLGGVEVYASYINPNYVDTDRQWQMARSGVGGVILAWTVPGPMIDKKRIAPDGTWSWPHFYWVSTHKSDYPSIAPTDDGGAIITFREDSLGTGGNIRAQLVDISGDMHWGSNGVEIYSSSYIGCDPQISPDDAGGAVISWYSEPDVPTSKPYTTHAQKIDVSGVVQWPSNGISLSTLEVFNMKPQ